ncbi:MAG: universal stress protein [Anaerolineae bacterium]|jgi:nucleotide-binding universal stress UspA family protein
MSTASTYHSILDFRRARRQASRERLVARLTGKSADLLSYEEVRRKLKAKTGQSLGRKDIPLDAIVGSVGRYSDFTRGFLPLQDEDEDRWARVQVKIAGLEGLPPIQVYQIGEAYFVRDGNHRVSVARRSGATHIEAYVTEVETRVPLSPDVQPDDLIVKAEYAGFLEHTHLDEIRPQADLSVTVPGQYPRLAEHIEVHHYFMGLDDRREVPYEEAVGHWYDAVYLPIVQTIRELGILGNFPGRTEADLYLWLSEHRAVLEAALGWEIEPEAAAVDLVEQFGPDLQHRMVRVTRWLADVLTPDELESGPAPGTWRRARMTIRRDDCLFGDILVSISGDDSGWSAVAQAAEIACRENARLMGLHVVASAAEKESDQVRAVAAEFARRCEAVAVRGSLAVEVGRVARTICERSHWADLVVVGLAHPPGPQPVAKLGSGFRTLIRRCPTPVLAVTGAFSPLSRPLLAYDGSPKSKEALYVAAYLAAQGQVPLAIVTVTEGSHVTPDVLKEAEEYLAPLGVQVIPVSADGPVAETILQAAEAYDNDLILMGGYGYGPVAEVVLGSAVDGVLRASGQPVLICR